MTAPPGGPRRRRNARKDPTAEAAFQDEVLGLARLYGWRAYHTHDSRRSAPGFPDLVLVRPPRLIFAELKTDTGRVKPEQEAWLEALAEVGAAVSFAVEVAQANASAYRGALLGPRVEVYLWRRRDLQAIADRLAGNGIDATIGRAWAQERRTGVQAVTPLPRHRHTLGGPGSA